MKKESKRISIIIISICFIFIVGLMIDSSRPKCLEVGCNNEQATGSGFCYLHKPYVENNTNKTNSYDRGTTNSKESKFSDTSINNSNKSDNTQNSFSSKKYKTIGPEDYDNPDDYASDFAEDYAYDEFGEDDSWEAYEYGYEEAYEYWLDEHEEN